MVKTDNISIVYIPSPVSCYIWNEPIEYEYESRGFTNVKTISNEEKRIELLKEYRQSLISEVVTGKRKVTN